jgi:hypothetical protein
MSTELTERVTGQDTNETRHILYLLGGAAIVFFGARLILSTPFGKKHLGDGIGNLLGAGIPKDIQRYLRLRAM